MDTIKYTLEDLERDVASIVHQINHSGYAPDAIIGLSRGGAVLATRLAYILDVEDMTVTDPHNVWAHTLCRNGNMLIVDDICDSGDTLVKLMQHPRIASSTRTTKTACAVYNTNQPFEVDFYGTKIDRRVTSNWFDFFWEEPVTI